MAQIVWGDTGQPLPELDYMSEDPSWTQHLPSGSTIISNVGWGSSYWSQAAKVEVRLRDGTTKRYFIKLTETHIGKLMAQGEFYGMTELYRFAPLMVPRPIAWGTFEASGNLHFFLCDFVDIFDERTPDMSKFCRQFANMHRASMGKSPTGKFGFPVVTCNATTQQLNEWRTSWEEFYGDKLRYLFERDTALRGRCPEYDELLPAFFEKVVPRLLRPLETGGNTLVPNLCHGDTWHGNLAVQVRADEPPLIFDASAFWGHREYDLKSMRWPQRPELKLNREWMHEYFKFFPPDEPIEDWDARNQLYNLSSALHDSVAFYKAPRYRQHVIDIVSSLVSKFPNGYTGPHERKGEEDVKVTERPDSQMAGQVVEV